MERTGSQIGGRLVSSATPVLLAFLGAAIANLPITLTGNHVPAPLLGLMPVYFWSLLRPDLMTPARAVLIGLTEDVLAPGAPGVWALSFVAMYAFVEREREVLAGLTGLPALMGFASASFITCSTAYLTECFLNLRMLPIVPTVAELAITIVLFAPIASFLSLVHRRVVGPLRSDF